MKKVFLLLFAFILSQNAFAVEIVYPSNNNLYLKSPSTFFIGSSTTPVKINGKNVKLHKTGAFSHVVKLKNGINTFDIESDGKKQFYTITAKPHAPKKSKQKPINFEHILILNVIEDRVPLRATPVDFGLNRITHLPKGTRLEATGEKGNFYKIYLTKHKSAWINKDYVKEADDPDSATLSIFDKYEDDKSYSTVFYLDKQVPFEVIEGDNFKINFYNTTKKSSFKIPYKKLTETDKLYGYKAEYSGNAFILSIRKPPKINTEMPLKNIKITIDPGHGGNESGAIGCLGEKEKEVNLTLSKYLEQELSSRGATVYMTRTVDKWLPLQDRVDFANQNDSMVFLSIHHNAVPDNINPNYKRGTGVYYYHNQAKKLGEDILNSVVTQTEAKNDGMHQRSFAVIRNTNALSLLIEVAYMINPDDNEMLVQDEFQRNYAKAVADGIEKYFAE